MGFDEVRDTAWKDQDTMPPGTMAVMFRNMMVAAVDKEPAVIAAMAAIDGTRAEDLHDEVRDVMSNKAEAVKEACCVATLHAIGSLGTMADVAAVKNHVRSAPRVLAAIDGFDASLSRHGVIEEGEAQARCTPLLDATAEATCRLMAEFLFRFLDFRAS